MPRNAVDPPSHGTDPAERGVPDSNAGGAVAALHQRIDKWLWHARLVRTRTAAADLAASGSVRINGRRIDAPSRAVRIGDVVTVVVAGRVRVLKVAGLVERRGSATVAQALYGDLTEPAAQASCVDIPPAGRESGAGRPTKRERRAIDRLLGRQYRGS